MGSEIARLKLDEALRRQKLERADEELQFKRAELRRTREILLLETKVKAADLRCLSTTSWNSGRSHSERGEQRLSKRESSRFSGEMTNSDDAILHWKQLVDQDTKSDELELTPVQPLLLYETGSQDTESATKQLSEAEVGISRSQPSCGLDFSEPRQKGANAQCADVSVTLDSNLPGVSTRRTSVARRG